ncbi:hypothetical protein [Cohnella sp. 56]|uniref:hypothetical protein n=1 Tax=Cohnella sp. 56 TaxID=3113722 RepID=UPI0030E90E5E
MEEVVMNCISPPDIINTGILGGVILDFDVSFSGWATALLVPPLIPFISIIVSILKITREEKLLLSPSIQIFTTLLSEIGKFLLITTAAIILGTFEIKGHSGNNRFPFVSDFPFPTLLIQISIVLTALISLGLLMLRVKKSYRIRVFTEINKSTKTRKGFILTFLIILIIIYAYVFFPLFLVACALGVISFYYGIAFKLNITFTGETAGYLFSKVPVDASIIFILLYLVLYVTLRLLYGQLIYAGNLYVSTKVIAHIKLITNEVMENVTIIRASIDGASLLVKNADDKDGNKYLIPKASILHIRFEMKQIKEHNLEQEVNNSDNHATENLEEKAADISEVAVTEEVAASSDTNSDSLVRILLPPDYK